MDSFNFSHNNRQEFGPKFLTPLQNASSPNQHQWSLSILHVNIKPLVFRCFQEGKERPVAENGLTRSRPFPPNIYLIKVNNRNTRKGCKICFKFNNKNIRTTSMTSFSFLFFIVSSEYISHLFLMFLLLLNIS